MEEVQYLIMEKLGSKLIYGSACSWCTDPFAGYHSMICWSFDIWGPGTLSMNI